MGGATGPRRVTERKKKKGYGEGYLVVRRRFFKLPFSVGSSSHSSCVDVEEKKEIKKKRAKLLLETLSRQPMKTVFPVDLVREERIIPQ